MIQRFTKTNDFQKHILELWKNKEEIDRIMSSTKDGDDPKFREGFKFGLIWAGLLCTATYLIDIGEENDIK